MTLAPHRWLKILEDVIRFPETILKQDSLKHTVKAGLSPWGDVCIQRTEWTMRKKLFSPIQPFRRKLFWYNLLELLDSGIRVTPPVLYMEVKEDKLIARSYLVTRWTDGPSLSQLAEKKNSSSENTFLNLLKRATHVIAYLHMMGFIHGDLKWSSILCDPSEPEQVILTDLEHIERTDSLTDQGKDLGRFIVSGYHREMDEDVMKWLIERYFFSAGYRPREFERSLDRYIKKNF